eukprot:scaffold130_cov120-Skeletonema_menzelii.AAC.1
MSHPENPEISANLPCEPTRLFQYTAAPAEHAMHDASWQTVLHHGDNLIINQIMDRSNAQRIWAQRTLSGSSFNKDSH